MLTLQCQRAAEVVIFTSCVVYVKSLLITSIFILQEIEVANIVHSSHEKISILKTKPELVLYNFVSLRIIYTACSRQLSSHNTKLVGIFWHCFPLLEDTRETSTAVKWH